MRGFLFGVFWALVLAVIGMMLLERMAALVAPALTMTANERGGFGLAGLVIGICLFALLRHLGTLPGLRRNARVEPPGWRRVLGGAIWFSGLSILGMAAGFWLARKFFPAMEQEALRGLPEFVGEAVALAVFINGVNANRLPGLHRAGESSARDGARWGVAQAAWLVAGFLLLQVVGAVACSFLIVLITHLSAALRHVPPAPAGSAATIAAAVDGYLACALWSVWYINRLGPARVRDGGPSGIGWRAAPGRAYATAVVFAVVIIAVVMLLFHLVPPNEHLDSASPMMKIFGRPGWPIFILLLLASFVAPPVEEWVFRGGIFAALSGRLSPPWAGLVTTILFVAMHAPEKIHYPLGFIDVAMLAVGAMWLRVRYGSIRPGILLHVLYNGGGVLAAALLPHLA